MLEKHGFGDDRAGAVRAQQAQSGSDEVNEQRREMAHAQQRSAGIAECNRWNAKASALQNGNSHPTGHERRNAHMRMTSANSPNGTVVGVGVEVSVSLVIASVSRSAPANRRPSGRRWCWLDTRLLILHHKEAVMRKIYALSLLAGLIAGLTAVAGNAQNAVSEVIPVPAHPYGSMNNCPTAQFVCAVFSPGSTVSTSCLGLDCKNYGRTKNDHIALRAERDSVNATNVLSRNWGVTFASSLGAVIVLYNNCDVVSPIDLIKLNQLQLGRPDYDPTPQMLEPDANTKQFPTLNLYTRENSFFGVLQHACGMRLLIDGTRYDEHLSADPDCLGWVECVNPTN